MVAGPSLPANRRGIHIAPLLFCAPPHLTADDVGSSQVEESRDQKYPTEPPKVIWPACGAFCDIFWWTRREPKRVESPKSPSDSPPIKR